MHIGERFREVKWLTQIISIVFVHGLQGHPYKTWASKGDGSAEPSPILSGLEPSKQHRKKILRRLIQRRPKTLGDIARDQDSLNHGSPNTGGSRPIEEKFLSSRALSVFWPADLLPIDCPQARIMTWGYDSKITKYMAASVNQNSIFSHSKDLMFSLQRMRVVKRPLVFVAHSLGGIIVKEVSRMYEANLSQYSDQFMLYRCWLARTCLQRKVF